MINKKLWVILFVFISTIGFFSCKSKANLTDNTPTINSKIAQKKPYVILVSLDGFRWDYVEKYKPPHLSQFINNGVNAKSLIPSFPSKTFPNHYTIATGLYPDNHGLLGNSFYSYKKDVTYKIRNRELVEDGTFYKGTPIWVQADKSDIVTASFFFVGSEADIQKTRPRYYYRYDGSITKEARVIQALEWLKLPKKDRPHLITMYFSDMDDTGHRYSPDNEKEIKKALFELDKNLGDLFNGVKTTGLPVNIIVVSDHGMATVPVSKFIPVESILNDNLYTAIDNGSIINIHPKQGIETDSILRFLKSKESNFKVYKTENTPEFETKPKNKDWGEIQIIADFGYYFIPEKRIESRKEYPDSKYGVHGYSPNYKDMHGIFYANGPAFKKGYTMPSVKNIHIYPLICEILKIPIPKNIDGNLDKIESILK